MKINCSNYALFHWLVIFLKNIFCNVCTKRVHETIFLLKGRTNLVCLVLLLFPSAVQECVLNFIVTVIEKRNKKICTIIQPSVIEKCPGFCKCLIFSKSGFTTFSNYLGCQKWTALSASDRRIMINFSLRVVDRVLVENKYKACINCDIIRWYET